jgi:DNA-binding transcriptional LysR family regulator
LSHSKKKVNFTYCLAAIQKRMEEFAVEWSDLKIFLAIARKGTLGGAARVLGLTQPTMGRRLKALEQGVGRPLFQRTSEGLVLTEDGLTVLAHAERMETEAESIERQLSGSSGRLQGLLRLSCSDWFGVHVLSPLLAQFHRHYPSVTVEVLTDARLLNLARREADLVFRILPFTEPYVKSRRLVTIPYGLYVSDDLPAPAFDGRDRLPLILMDEAFARMPDVTWLTALCPEAPVAMRSNNRDVQAGLCRHGVGLAVLPRPLGDATAGIRLILSPGAPPSRDTFVGYHQDMERMPRLRALLDLVVAKIGSAVRARNHAAE